MNPFARYALSIHHLLSLLFPIKLACRQMKCFVVHLYANGTIAVFNKDFFLSHGMTFSPCKAFWWILWCFLFYQKKNVHFISKNAISCLFLKNVSPTKRVICFILNNLHFPMVEGIAVYALYKSRVLIIACKADDFRLFIGLPYEI